MRAAGSSVVLMLLPNSAESAVQPGSPPTAHGAQEILDKIVRLYERAIEAAEKTPRPDRADTLRMFAANLHRAFYGIEPDFFQQNLLRIVDDVVSVIKGSIQLWPTLIEICYFQKGRTG